MLRVAIDKKDVRVAADSRGLLSEAATKYIEAVTDIYKLCTPQYVEVVAVPNVDGTSVEYSVALDAHVYPDSRTRSREWQLREHKLEVPNVKSKTKVITARFEEFVRDVPPEGLIQLALLGTRITTVQIGTIRNLEYKFKSFATAEMFIGEKATRLTDFI